LDMPSRVVLLVLAAALVACGGSGATQVEQLTVEIVERRPHDPSAFTQGLQLAGGRLYESTGLYGESTLREVEPDDGTVLRMIDLADEYFGEGIAVVDDRIMQLTWQEHTALVYSLSDFVQVGTFAYVTEGWGLCDEGSRLVMSDGTSQLTFRDRTTFEISGAVSVTRDGVPIEDLNELECVDEQVYANLHRHNEIVRIDPATGRVTAVIDASAIVAEAGSAGVLNGIAYDAEADTFLLTGKNWPTLFEVRLVRR
jgi:glutaminyl-peptide cyclotransferase